MNGIEYQYTICPKLRSTILQFKEWLDFTSHFWFDTISLK